MKNLIKTIPLILVFLSTALFAQEPVVGVADPESLFVDDVPALHRNKQTALHIMRELLQCNYWDRAGEWLTDRYIQHNPNAGSGLAGVVYYFTEVANRKPTEACNELTTEVVAVIAEDDLVTVMTPRRYPHPTNKGEFYYTTWFDTWRFVDGKADEHWDPAMLSAR
ncbi:nuclear transport factor 2 family protein [Malonomonas rubra]|uniref:nuclear transport factor 2 family protein n=1 Tax=Malonomonas rubra TaxID=57040 RepID=UPI0026ED2A9B|nr:nuclear transport factor 2 family protein [Malonomonas rubra]